jgi:hypothetical protein
MVLNFRKTSPSLGHPVHLPSYTLGLYHTRFSIRVPNVKIKDNGKSAKARRCGGRQSDVLRQNDAIF